MTTSERARAGSQSILRHLSISSKFTLAVLPLAVVASLAAIFAVWNSDGADPVSIVIAAVVGLASLGTLLTAFLVGRSVATGVAEVTRATDRMARKDLLDMLDALRGPEPDLSSIEPLSLDVDRRDEVGDLARSVTGMHRAVIDVAGRQMEALRSGVSNIFVTLARRNSSLVDRQLAVLDELEAREESSKTLSGYYRLDHLATRMRRNAESLLVLAGSEAPRVWAKPTEMSDVVRAAIGEVDEFHRIEVPALEPARLSGGAVSDLAHLLAELLENAIQFSPPSEPVRVTGLFGPGGYQLTVSDRGVGVSEARAAELNRILEKPPALGLSVEPTLGMFVVSKLAHRHGVHVELIRGVPGLTALVTVPRDYLQVVKEAEPSAVGAPRHIREPEGPDLSEYDDAATRDYLLKRAGLYTRTVTVEEEQVIDLTREEMAQPGEPVVAETGLPRRDPGTSLAEDDPASPSTGPGEGAIGIKSALSAFDAGRRAAEDANAEMEDEA